MKNFEIFLDDLTEAKKAELLEFLGDNGNYDIYPIAVIQVEADSSTAGDKEDFNFDEGGNFFIEEDFADVLDGPDDTYFRISMDELDCAAASSESAASYMSQLFAEAIHKVAEKYCLEFDYNDLTWDTTGIDDGANAIEWDWNDKRVLFKKRTDGKMREASITVDEIVENCYQIAGVAEYLLYRLINL